MGGTSFLTYYKLGPNAGMRFAKILEARIGSQVAFAISAWTQVTFQVSKCDEMLTQFAYHTLDWRTYVRLAI